MLVHVQLDGVETAMPLAEFEDLVRGGTIGPETPVRLGALTAGGWVAAGTLSLFRDLRDSPQALVRRGWANPPAPWMTALIVGITVRVFLLSRVPGHADIVAAGWKSGAALLERGEVWRLLTYGAFHANLQHLLGNGVFLAYIGAAIETLAGPAVVGTLFLVSVAGGGLLSVLVAPGQDPTIGASGGDFGFLAAAFVLGWRYHDVLPAKARPRFGTVIGLFMAWTLFNGLFDAKVDNLCHLFGTLTGGLFTLLVRPRDIPSGRARNRVVCIGTVAALGVVIAGWLALPLPTETVATDGLVAARPTWWTDGWTPAGERGWTSSTSEGSAVIRTSHLDHATSTDHERELLVGTYQTLDPQLVMERDEPLTIDGVAGRRLRFTYTGKDGARRVDAAVFGRGRYAQLALLDRSAGRSRLDRLVGPVVDDARLPPLDAAKELADSDESVPGMLRRARVAADVGEIDAALALADAARAKAPAEPAPVEVGVTLASEWARPDALDRAEAAIAAFPADPRVLEAAVHAWTEAGRQDRARAVLDAALAAAPGDRKVKRLLKELDAAE